MPDEEKPLDERYDLTYSPRGFVVLRPGEEPPPHTGLGPPPAGMRLESDAEYRERLLREPPPPVPGSMNGIEMALLATIEHEVPAGGDREEVRRTIARRWLGLPAEKRGGPVTADELYRWRGVLEQSLDGLAVLNEKDLRSEDHGKAKRRIEGVANELFERYVDLLPGRRG